MENCLQWKTTFNGRGPAMKDDLRWKTIFLWRMSFDGRQPAMEDDLYGRGPLMQDDLQ